MLVQCAGAAKLRISIRDEVDTTPGAHPTVEIAVTGGDSKPYLEYSVVGEVYPGGKLRATVVARNADKLTSDESVTITDEMGSFTQTVTGYDSVKVENSSIQLHGSKAKYALLPVWVLSTSWRGNNYIFCHEWPAG